MAIEWTDDLATGSEIIDNQHKELFRKMNDLMNACRHGVGKTKVRNTLQFLDDYIVYHFTEEESLMAKYNYPQAPHHISEHQIFSANFYELKKQFQKDGPGVHIVLATNKIVPTRF